MIINLRGTHGSGKSTAVAKLMQEYFCEPIFAASNDKRPIAYKLTGAKEPVFIIGPYETQCGGCDAIQPYASIWPLVLKYSKKGHVFFEGALVSCSIGSIGEAMVKRKDCVVAYLDTPLQTCIERIQKRRAKKGDTRPLNPKNTEAKFKSVAVTRAKFETLGVQCVTIRHKQAVKDLLEVLYGS